MFSEDIRNISCSVCFYKCMDFADKRGVCEANEKGYVDYIGNSGIRWNDGYVFKRSFFVFVLQQLLVSTDYRSVFDLSR